ncbi:MAG: MarR family transcriptional regulator [Proteobacteria bacterium]|nr:MarR family transcriptional regulator [Pseudomonadota bacterium]
MASLNLNEQFCFSLYRASRSVIRLYGPLLKSLGITYPQYLVMLVLWEKQKASVKEIGIQVDLDSATLTPLIRKLEDFGFVSKSRSTTDERIVDVTLTPIGRSLKAKAQKIPEGLKLLLHLNSPKKSPLDYKSIKRDLDQLFRQIES